MRLGQASIRCCCVAIVLLAVHGPAAAQTSDDQEAARAERPAVRDAPFTVVAFSATHVRVDIGADKRRAQDLRRATILTEAGPIAATLVRARRVCEWLCGDEGDGDEATCHYEAILRASTLPSRPLAVLTGQRVVTDVRAFPASPEQRIESDRRWLESTPFGEGTFTYRWQRFPDGVYMTSGSSGRSFHAPPIGLTECTQRSASPFTLLTCEPHAQFLYEGPRAIVSSFGEYATNSTRPILRFTLNGRDAVLIRLGLKAETIAALLLRDGTTWRLVAEGADYALMC